MDDNFDKIDKISKIEEGENSSDEAIRSDFSTKNIEVNKEHFDSLMLQEKKEALSTQAIEDKGKKPTSSLMDEIGNLNSKVNHIARANPKDIAQQADKLVAQIDELKTKLETPNLELKNSVKNLLHNKLSHIDESLKIALSKAGVEYVPPAQKTGITTPMERFLGFLTDAQHQLQHIGNEVQGMALNKTELSPATMLAVQIKVNYVQQEVEFFTALLNKALESTKTIMNVQV